MTEKTALKSSITSRKSAVSKSKSNSILNKQQTKSKKSFAKSKTIKSKHSKPKQETIHRKTAIPKKNQSTNDVLPKAVASKPVESENKRPKRITKRIKALIRQRLRQARFLIGLLFSMVVADGLISNYIINNNHGTEGNPLIESIVGQAGFITVKVAAAIISGWMLWRIVKRHTRLGLACVIFFVLVYTAILWWNLSIWFIDSHNVQF